MATYGSPGCALAEPVVPAVLDNDLIELHFIAPAVYDGVRPVPLIIMFHATNQTSDYAYLTKDQPDAARYLIAVPRNIDPGYFENAPPSDYTALLDRILGALCIDERAVFGVGNGSGGRFLTSWLAARSKAGDLPAFRGAAMVGTAIRPRVPPLPLIFIHALDSRNSAAVAQDADGLKALDLFLLAEQCGDTTTPVDAAECVVGSTQVHPGCVDYDGCAAPFRFCHHDGPDGQGDVWPCIASPAIYQFFAPLLPDAH